MNREWRVRSVRCSTRACSSLAKSARALDVASALELNVAYVSIRQTLTKTQSREERRGEADERVWFGAREWRRAARGGRRRGRRGRAARAASSARAPASRRRRAHSSFVCTVAVLTASWRSAALVCCLSPRCQKSVRRGRFLNETENILRFSFNICGSYCQLLFSYKLRCELKDFAFTGQIHL